ncbi:hypothetical protein [Nocardia asteroides]|uniref:hypothetical protein n=1 Tax=Nocardia asteroides TaxID=1824 RepID=UPI00342A4CCD
MHDLVNTFIGTVAGLGTGILTGFFFERRSTRSARADVASLEDQLRILREVMYSAGLNPNETNNALVTGPLETAPAVLDWIRNHQDASGRVDRKMLVTHFLADGFQVSEVERALADLCAGGEITQTDDWLMIA